MIRASKLEPLATGPSAYRVVYERVMETELTLATDRDGSSERKAYKDWLGQFTREHLVESSWNGFDAVSTRIARYTRPLKVDVREEDLAVWQLLAFDAHLRASLNRELSEAVWLVYEHSQGVHEVDRIHEVFFVVVGNKVVDDRFLLSGSYGVWPSERLEKKGIWASLQPAAHKPHWTNDIAWEFGRLRSWYRAFYEETETGKMASMIPNNPRLDAQEFWLKPQEPVEKETSPDLFRIQVQLEGLRTRLSWTMILILSVLAWVFLWR